MSFMKVFYSVLGLAREEIILFDLSNRQQHNKFIQVVSTLTTMDVQLKTNCFCHNAVWTFPFKFLGVSCEHFYNTGFCFFAYLCNCSFAIAGGSSMLWFLASTACDHLVNLSPFGITESSVTVTVIFWPNGNPNFADIDSLAWCPLHGVPWLKFSYFCFPLQIATLPVGGIHIWCHDDAASSA